MVGERFAEAFIRVLNPHAGSVVLRSGVLWFRDVFLEMARDADCETFNCTEGGILFGGPEISDAARAIPRRESVVHG